LTGRPSPGAGFGHGWVVVVSVAWNHCNNVSLRDVTIRNGPQ
jgi:hypothetical protein